MRREKTEYVPIGRFYSVRKEIGGKRLQLLGSIAMNYTFIEDMTDSLLHAALRLHPEFHYEISSRINGTEGKVAILNKVLSINVVLDDQDGKSFKDSLATIIQCKLFRDSIIHALVIDPKDDFALSAPNRGASSYKFAFSSQYLSQINLFLQAFLQELIYVYRIMEGEYFIQDDFDVVNEHGGSVSPEKTRSSKRFRQSMAQYRRSRSRRQALLPR